MIAFPTILAHLRVEQRELVRPAAVAIRFVGPSIGPRLRGPDVPRIDELHPRVVLSPLTIAFHFCNDPLSCLALLPTASSCQTSPARRRPFSACASSGTRKARRRCALPVAPSRLASGHRLDRTLACEARTVRWGSWPWAECTAPHEGSDTRDLGRTWPV